MIRTTKSDEKAKYRCREGEKKGKLRESTVTQNLAEEGRRIKNCTRVTLGMEGSR